MPTSDLDRFLSHAAMLLRDLPLATSADITDFAIAYLSHRGLCFAYLREDGSGLVDEDFDLTENEWEQWRDELLAWQANPTFSERADLLAWLRAGPGDQIGPV